MLESSGLCNIISMQCYCIDPKHRAAVNTTSSKKTVNCIDNYHGTKCTLSRGISFKIKCFGDR